MSRWSELPLWAWALGLRNGVNFRAAPDSSSPGVGRAPQPTLCTGPTAIDEAQVITSAVEYPQATGWHKPVLDIDFPAQLIPSSTEGHFHLYLDKELPWDKYQRLLTALAEAGIIEVGYANASIARGYTSVRLPWVHRADDPVEEPEAPTEAPVPAEPVVHYDAARRQYLIGPRDGDNLILTNEWLQRTPAWPARITNRVAELGVTDWPAERDAAARAAGASWMAGTPSISPRRNLRQELIEGEARRQAEVNAATAARRTRERLIADSTFDRAAAGVAASIASSTIWSGNHPSLVADMNRLGEQARAGMDQATQSMQGFRSSLAIVDEATGIPEGLAASDAAAMAVARAEVMERHL